MENLYTLMVRYLLLCFIVLSVINVNPVCCIACPKNPIITPADVRIDTYLPLLKGKRVALLINQTSKINNTLLLDTLYSLKINITKIFVPEHGLRGQEDAGAHINNGKDSGTGIPVFSLYGKNKKPSAEQLKDVDVMIYDLQDVGVRFYTYISTLQYVMEACAEQHIQFIVLDKPNPNGFYVAGSVLDTSLRSFVGMQPIPIVYGMTVGEYAKMLQGEKWFPHAEQIDLKVIPCSNYNHNSKYVLPVPPSPNLKNMTAIYLYPSLCLFEGTVVSVGRGTNTPFQVWGHPDFKEDGAFVFTPKSASGATTPPYDDKTCYGEMVAYNTETALKVLQNDLCLTWLRKAYSMYPVKDKFFNDFFEKLAGTKELRKQIEQGLSDDNIKASWEKGLQKFKSIRKKYLLYKDFK
jgi:uncharacterized protein YbbC (DUF1343 family)